MSSSGTGVAILGIYVADLAFRAVRLPRIGETLLGSGFAMGPGGKGSNQAVAAARAGNGTPVSFITKLGRDAFADIGIGTWKADGIVTDFVAQTEEHATGAAFIFVSDRDRRQRHHRKQRCSGINLDCRPRCGGRGDRAFGGLRDAIRAAARRGAAWARDRPRGRRDDDLEPGAGGSRRRQPLWPVRLRYPKRVGSVPPSPDCPSKRLDQARAAGDDLLRRGAGVALITLGDKGVLYHSATESVHVPSFAVAKVVDTTGAGDAFNGGFAVALAEGRAPLDAVRFACATAALSVGKFGTAQSMPTRSEVEHLLNAHR